MKVTDEISELYYDSKKGFLSLPKFYQRVKEFGIDASYNDVRKFLELEEPYQRTKQVHRPREFSNTYATAPLQCIQIDLMISDRYAIHQYKYIIGAIDVYSRFAVARPLTNMRISTLMENLKDMFEEISNIIGKKKTQYPENINADQQFNKPEFVNFFAKQGTKLWFSQPNQNIINQLLKDFGEH